MVFIFSEGTTDEFTPQTESFSIHGHSDLQSPDLEYDMLDSDEGNELEQGVNFSSSGSQAGSGKYSKKQKECVIS